MNKQKKEYELFRIECTFSYMGTLDNAKKYFGKDDMIFEESEFVGTNEEHHSVVFSEIISVNNDGSESLCEVIEEYFRQNDLDGECYTVSTMEGVIIFREYEVKLN